MEAGVRRRQVEADRRTAPLYYQLQATTGAGQICGLMYSASSMSRLPQPSRMGLIRKTRVIPSM